jgi:hypothetical protein
MTALRWVGRASMWLRADWFKRRTTTCSRPDVHGRRRLIPWLGLFLLPGRALAVQAPRAETEPLAALRAYDATPSWFTSGNWGNGQYRPWTDYLVGRMAEVEFVQVCAAPSSYCLRDVWNLRRREPGPIRWALEEPGFNWPGIQALALRFFRTGDSIYLDKWIAVVRSFAQWTLARPAAMKAPLERGHPGPLLEVAMAWGGIVTAMGILAKGLDGASERGSPYAPVAATALPTIATIGSAGLTAQALAAGLADIAAAFSQGDARVLARHYASARYVPNQRVFGLEALAQMAAFFPTVPGLETWAPAAHAALLDAAQRYSMPDGGQVEASFNYAQALVQCLERCAKLPFPAEQPWRAPALEMARRWWRLVAAVAVPTGGMPQLGNTSWGRAGRGAPTERFAATSMAFPYAGLYVMRGDWTAESPYLFFFHRRAARGHTMAGGNSLQVAAHGRPLLGAGGSAVYGGPAAGDHALKAYLSEASSWKTCTVLVDERSQAPGSTEGLALGVDGRPDITRAPQAPTRVRWLASPELDVLESDHREGYRGTLDDPKASLVSGVVHTRRVVFVRPMGLWVVVDVMRATGTHAYTQVWKFPPPNREPALSGFDEPQVEVLPRERRIQTRDLAARAPNVDLLHFGPPALQYRRFFGAQGLGWFNPGPLTRPEPAVDVHAQWRGTGPQVLITVIAPRRGQQSPLTRVADLTRGPLAGCELATDDGLRLTVTAAAQPLGMVALGEPLASEMVVGLAGGGQSPTAISLAPEEAWRWTRSRREPITVPAGFSWQEDAGGLLRPRYG